MKRILGIGLAIASIVVGAGTVQAAPLNDYTLNFSYASGLLGGANADLDHVDAWQFLGNSVVGFHDNDANGFISAGDTFYDYVAVRVTNFADAAVNDITPLTYGGGPGRDHQITVVARFSGLQTVTAGIGTPGAYVVTGLDQFDFFFDAGGGFSAADFNNLGTFSNGLLVEQAGLIEGHGTQDLRGIPDGNIDLILSLTDLLHTYAATGQTGEYFEVDENGDAFDMNLVLGIVDSNNQSKAVNLAAFESYFGFDAAADFDFFFTTSNDGSFEKEMVPEPGTMILLGSGLLGVAGVARRRKIS